MSITPKPPAEASWEKFKHGSNLSGNYRTKRVSSKWQSTARDPQHLERVVVHADHLVLTIGDAQDDQDHSSQTLTVPWTKPSQNRHKELLQPTDLAQPLRVMEGDERMRLLRGFGVTRMFDLPPMFEDQWRALGLTRPQR